MPTALVRQSIGPETAYSELAESMTSFLKCMQSKDPEARKRIAQEQASPSETSSDLTWTVNGEGLLRYEGKAYVLNNKTVRYEVLSVNHDDPTGGHMAWRRTLANIRRKYYWHGMNAEVKEYVNTCDICQRIKVHRHAPYGKLQPLPVPKGPGDWMSLDFITGLPPS